jgi:transposase-like protein
MGKGGFSDDFKRDGVVQIIERGYTVAEVSNRLGVSLHSLYAWKKKYSQPAGGGDRDAEIRRLKRELTRVTEERDILKKPPRISPGMQSEIRVRCRASPPVCSACDVSLPAHPPQRLLCLAQEPVEQTGPGRRPSDRAHQDGRRK